MQNEMHTHNFIGVTTLNDGHTHQYSGFTSSSANVPGHIHAMIGTTTVNDRHRHGYNQQTSQSISVMEGHTHNYQASTSFVDGHDHNLSGNTSVYKDRVLPAQLQPRRPGVPGPFIPPGQFPPGRPGPSGPPTTPPGQGPRGAPSSPPPSFEPVEPLVTPFALDPGAVLPCRFRFSYIWPRRGRPFWAWIIFVGRRSFAGFRWTGRRWVYFAMDLRDVRSIQCF